MAKLQDQPEDERRTNDFLLLEKVGDLLSGRSVRDDDGYLGVGTGCAGGPRVEGADAHGETTDEDDEGEEDDQAAPAFLAACVPLGTTGNGLEHVAQGYR